MLLRFAPRFGLGDRYAIKRPLETHWRPARCEEVDCPHYLSGWVTIIDERTSFGQAQASYIRTRSRRSFREERDAAGMTQFIFAPGQRCFREHKLPEKPPFFTQQRVQGAAIVLPFAEWTERYNETVERVNVERSKG